MLLNIWQKPAKILCGGIQLKYRSQRFPKVEVKEKISSDSKITENVRKQKTMQMSQQKINQQNHFQKLVKTGIPHFIVLHFVALCGYYIFYAIEVFWQPFMGKPIGAIFPMVLFFYCCCFIDFIPLSLFFLDNLFFFISYMIFYMFQCHSPNGIIF